MDNISINIKGIEEIAKKFGTQPIRQAINIAIKKATIYMQLLSREEAPVGVGGQLRGGVDVEISDLKGRVFNKMKYSEYVVQGTAPHFPPIKAITAWANSKGISPRALAFSISRKGTKANPYFDRAMEKGTSKVNEIADKEIQNLVTSLNK